MKNTSLLLFLLLSCVNLFSQKIPEIKLDKGSVSVKKLKVNVEIVGDIAITTYDMSFYNSTNRVLEGELNFPLGENQSVTRFALDINGKLREAVVVEKEKARVAFESTVRKRIDPALLEKTVGNNYKARIYPIPKRGYKRVVLAYQQKLTLNNDSYYYKIPFSFKKKFEEFSLSINVLNQNGKPIVSKGLLNDFKFDSKRNRYSAKINRRRYRVSKPLLIKIPLNIKKQKLIESDEYFYFTSKLKVDKKKNKKTNEMTLFWDSSLSQKDRKINTEIELLDAYFKKNNDVKVNLVVFNFKKQFQKKYFVINGNWSQLKNKLLSTIYDGATSFDFFKDYRDSSDENFVFTNGLNTISNIKLNFTKRTHFVNSLTSANHSQLKYLANSSGGNYINLQQASINDAILKIENIPLQILGTNFSNSAIEIYPKVGSVVSEHFSFSGKSTVDKKHIEIYIGSGTDTLATVRFQLKENSNNIKIVQSLWAQGKLNDLAVNSKENEREIIRLSKKYKVISPFTSLLILDGVEDYVTHEIIPPNELQKKYFELLSQRINNKKERINKLRKNLLEEYSSFAKWSGQIVAKDSLKVVVEESIDTIMNTVVNTNPINVLVVDTLANVQLDRNEFILNGVVNDDRGSLPGVSIVLKGTTNGTETDFDGKFSIRANLGDVLLFSYLGYVTVEKTLGSRNSIRVFLVEDANVLDEVVVTALGVQRSSMKLGFATSKFKVDNIQGSTSKINLEGWNPDTPYLKTLNKIKDSKLAYKEYLKLRKEYGKSPSFYIDVADFFKKKKEFEIAKLILTNVAEIDLSNYELLKALAYKFEEYNLWEYAVYIYKEILNLRPEDIQSYRDLALAYEQIGEYQKSFDLLYKIVNGELLEKDFNRRYKGAEIIAFQELNRVIKLYREKINYSQMDKSFIINATVDIKILIDWNHNDTDIDLWVYEPNGDKSYYKNKKTKIGGLMSNDMTDGFGPEQYILKKAINGTYKIEIDYYSDEKQKISGPTFLKVTTFINYAKKNEKRKVRLIRLKKDDDETIDLGSILFSNETSTN